MLNTADDPIDFSRERRRRLLAEGKCQNCALDRDDGTKTYCRICADKYRDRQRFRKIAGTAALGPEFYRED